MLLENIYSIPRDQPPQKIKSISGGCKPQKNESVIFIVIILNKINRVGHRKLVVSTSRKILLTKRDHQAWTIEHMSAIASQKFQHV
jgi:hypothetical protein